jgi:hypothetical protein
MPCSCAGMEPSSVSIKMSQVLCCLDELAGKSWEKRDWEGYHEKAYQRRFTQKDADKLVSHLCELLQQTDVTKYSLELQMWWRDHQREDKERIERELADAELKEEKAAALAKLTTYERKLLGLG